jgi:hypothetical protein
MYFWIDLLYRLVLIVDVPTLWTINYIVPTQRKTTIIWKFWNYEMAKTKRVKIFGDFFDP